jgi:hypothetical protein
MLPIHKYLIATFFYPGMQKKEGNHSRSKQLQAKFLLAHRHFRQQGHPLSPLFLSLNGILAFQEFQFKQKFKKENK